MKADPETSAEVKKAFLGMWKAYECKDLEGVLAGYAPDPDTVVLGSGPDEIYVGPRQARKGLKRDFEQSQDVHVKLSGVRVSAAGKVAWLSANCTFLAHNEKGAGVVLAGRISAVLEKRRSQWLVAQSHFSMPYGEQDEGRSFPNKK